MSIAASALVIAAALMPAANAYKCKQADGSIAFQQTPCAATAEQLGQQSYEHQPDAPHQQYVPSRDGPEARKQAEAEEAEVSARFIAGQRGLLAPTAPSERSADGYSCSDGGKTWIQQTPCPSTVMADRFVPVTQAVGPHGERANGAATVSQETAVQQRAITRDEVCRQVRSGAATQHKEQRASDASYERNKLRSQYGC
ncbi:MAG TPA: hypothetical protein VN153_00055 [Tahibacter sp.]|nr:hypothetical protein [Tahibacter sp.]